ncbi:MAG: diguanylate cyclase [Okeania sp. SIO3B5]|uniref:sensor domain-containing diguanylate cyclase n=1 Tax=Okeania sp. SIO3B5 TaxID=2607811 RepID=UPI0013FF6A9E|nr:diguanylate cyclase [Okeania sp. SIO3B5]NEO52152.1 diguanylate cyclase [Okeania sp. SIO3B5]
MHPNFLSDSELISEKKFSKILAEISLKIRQSLELDYILNTAVAVVRDLLNVDRVFIYKFQPDGSGIVEVESVSYQSRTIINEVLYDPCFKEDLIDLYKHGRVSSATDITNSNLPTCYVELLLRFQVRSILVVPILQGDDLWGLLIAHHCIDAREWQNSEIELLQQLSVQMAIAIQQAELYQQLQEELKQRQQAQTKLKEVNKQLKAKLTENKIYADIVKNMQVGLHVWQMEDLNDVSSFRLKATNPAVTHLTGYQEKEIMGKRISECFPHLLKTDLPEIYAEVIHSGKNRDLGEIEYFEQRIPHSIFAVKAFPLLNNCVGILFENVTVRQETENELKRQKKVMQMLTTMNPDGILIVDTEGVIQFVNPAGALLFGRTEDELIGKAFGFPLVVGERVEIDIVRPLDELCVEIGMAEMRLGNIIWEGKEAYLASFRDITERKRTEKTLREMNEAIAQEIQEREQAQNQSQEANKKLTNWIEALESRNQEITLLNNMIDLLQACFTVEEACQVILPLIQNLFPNTYGSVFKISDSRMLVEAIANWGEKIPEETLFAPHECIALRRGEVHFVEDTQTALTCKHLPQPLPKTTLCIPIMAQGQAIGVISFYYQEKTKITKEEHQLAITLAKQFGLALANLKLQETLKIQSIRDPLTGLFNRRYLEEFLNRETYRAIRTEKPIGIIMIDVDHFKKFNDEFGHAAGDIILKSLGSFLKQKVRDYDIACRYGGEELIMILPGSSLENTARRAEQIRKEIKQLSVEYDGILLSSITVSLGVACFPEHGKTGEKVIQAADAALYQAKYEGRNRVAVAPKY